MILDLIPNEPRTKASGPKTSGRKIYWVVRPQAPQPSHALQQTRHQTDEMLANKCVPCRNLEVDFRP